MFVRRFTALAALSLVALFAISGLAAADTHDWTTQADFQSGTLIHVDATAVPGSLRLAENTTAFYRYPQNPVFGPGAAGSWEQSNINYVDVIYDASVYKMWYAGCTGNNCDIGYATSPDGIAWTRYAGNPVLNATAGAWDANVGNPRVIHDGGLYKMWYSGDNLAGSIRLGYATSPDGIHWTKYSANPVFAATQSWEAGAITAPVIVHGSLGYTMWFAGEGTSGAWSIGYATSTDGINWTAYAGNPILSASLPYEASNLFPMTVLQGATGYELYYGCGYPGHECHATSSDGIAWTRDPLYPVLSPGLPGTWDSTSVGDFKVLVSGSRRMMWYIAYGTISQVGLALNPGYDSVGTFTSAVFDSGSPNTTWSSLSWTGSNTSLTAIGISIAVGNTSTPDSSWHYAVPYATSPASLTVPKARYAIVLAALVSLDPTQTPTLDSITVTYQPPTPPGFGGLGATGLLLLLLLIAAGAVAITVMLYLFSRSRARPPPTAAPGTAGVRCGACGAEVPPNNRFCGTCGTPLGPPGPGAPPQG